MNSYLILCLGSLVGIGLLVGCGSDPEKNYRRSRLGSLDAVPTLPVSFSFSLPARASFNLDAHTLMTKVNGFAWRIEPQGEKCRDTSLHEGYGPYEDNRVFAMEVSGTCSYSINIKIGELSSGSLWIAAPINYDQHIQPIINKQCVSCHAEYANYQGVRANARNIVSRIEAETMPPKLALGDSEIALFLAWGDGGFIEKNLSQGPVSKSEQALSHVYYRNDNNDVIFSNELLGRTFYELRRSLWIQPDGEALGLSTSQLFTFRTEIEKGP